MAEALKGQGTGVKHTDLHFNFGARVRASAHSRPVASFLSIALFAALVVALAFTV